jgi:hypothetical protein
MAEVKEAKVDEPSHKEGGDKGDNEDKLDRGKSDKSEKRRERDDRDLRDRDRERRRSRSRSRDRRRSRSRSGDRHRRDRDRRDYDRHRDRDRDRRESNIELLKFVLVCYWLIYMIIICVYCFVTTGRHSRDRTPPPPKTAEELEAERQAAEIEDLTKDQRTVFVSQLVMKADERIVKKFFEKVILFPSIPYLFLFAIFIFLRQFI